jgi:hypothetical protein
MIKIYREKFYFFLAGVIFLLGIFIIALIAIIIASEIKMKRDDNKIKNCIHDWKPYDIFYFQDEIDNGRKCKKCGKIEKV